MSDKAHAQHKASDSHGHGKPIGDRTDQGSHADKKEKATVLSLWEIKLKKERPQALPDPYGYKKSFSDDNQGQEQRDDLEKKAMAIAKGGLGNIFMLFFFMYMVGGSLNLVSISMIMQMLSMTFSQFAKFDSAFASLNNRGISLFVYKFIYLSIAMFQLSIVLYKLYNIGILPLNAADWLHLVPFHHQQQIVVPYRYGQL